MVAGLAVRRKRDADTRFGKFSIGGASETRVGGANETRVGRADENRRVR